MDARTIFETPRLILRPFVMDDLPAVYARARDPDVMRFQNCGTLTAEQAENSLRKAIAKAEVTTPFGIRAVVLKETKQNIGYCKLGHLPVLEWNPIEISYQISQEAWGNGYATEAAAVLVEHGFDGLHLEEIVAAINPLNASSARVAQKLGLVAKEKVEWPEQGLVDLYVITQKGFKDMKEANKPSQHPAEARLPTAGER